MPTITTYLIPKDAEALLPLVAEAATSRGEGDLVMATAQGRHDSLLISKFPASVDQQAFTQAVANRIKSGGLSGIRNLHDGSDVEQGTRFVVGLTRDADLGYVTQELLDEVRLLHLATSPAASSALEALSVLAQSDSVAPVPVPIDRDFRTLLTRRLDDLALLCELRGDLRLQAHWEAVVDHLQGAG